jgi:hypothetical protein
MDGILVAPFEKYPRRTPGTQVGHEVNPARHELALGTRLEKDLPVYATARQVTHVAAGLGIDHERSVGIHAADGK